MLGHFMAHGPHPAILVWLMAAAAGGRAVAGGGAMYCLAFHTVPVFLCGPLRKLIVLTCIFLGRGDLN